MPIETVKAEKSIDQLVLRVYGKLAPASLDLARKGLLEANPHLSATAPLKRGTVIDVPTLARQPGTGAPAARSRSAPASAADVVDDAVVAVDAWRKAVGRRLEVASSELDQMQKLLDDDAVRKSLAGSKGAPELLERARAAGAARRAELADDRAFVGGDLAKIDEALRTLLKAFG